METNCDFCGVFMTKDQEIICCGTCGSRYFCSMECMKKENNEHQCFDMNEFARICKKLQKAGLIRHVNGDTGDNRLCNLQRVSVSDSLYNKDWTVDAVCKLTKKEFAMWRSIRNIWRSNMIWREIRD